MTATRMQTVLTLMVPISVHVWKGILVMGIHVRVNFPLLIKKMKALASLFPVFLLFFLACFRLLVKFLSSYLSLFSSFLPSFSLLFLFFIFFIPCFLLLHRFDSIDVYECIRNHSCQINSSCTNIRGSRFCACQAEVITDGSNCTGTIFFFGLRYS